ncbi:MAG TPA: hypothetical protein PLN56_08470 [Methanoregulaceae archaeon]|nr:hypothetical protein [Methanoregulaceae archaeon]
MPGEGHDRHSSFPALLPGPVPTETIALDITVVLPCPEVYRTGSMPVNPLFLGSHERQSSWQSSRCSGLVPLEALQRPGMAFPGGEWYIPPSLKRRTTGSPVQPRPGRAAVEKG